MKKYLLLLYILLAESLFISCNSVNNNPEDDGIYLRVLNSSSLPFRTVYISFPGAEALFENLEPGNISAYRKLDTAYRYGYIRVETGDKEYVLQPFDYVGEKPLGNGQYSYELDISENILIFKFSED